MALLLAAALFIGEAPAQEALRPELGKPLLAAQDLVKAQRFSEALGRVREADAVAGKTPYESFMVERMRIAAASGAGDVETAARAFEALAGSGRLSQAEKLRMIESIAGGTYRAGDHAAAVRWLQRYVREGGSSPAMRTLLIQSQYLSGDYAGAARELTAEIQATERSGAAPVEDRLKLLLNAALKLNDNTTYVFAMEKLVTHHPRREYWVDLLSRLQRKPNFPDRLALDSYRLSLATGSMSSANDYMEMAQLALQAGSAGEGRQVLEKGFAAGVLGTGPQAERHERLRGLVLKRLEENRQSLPERERQAAAARDGNALVDLGSMLVFEGQVARGLRLLQQGVAKGGLKRPDDARLHLGIAQLLAGDSARALATFRAVSGSDGTADLARLWALHARRKS